MEIYLDARPPKGVAPVVVHAMPFATAHNGLAQVRTPCQRSRRRCPHELMAAERESRLACDRQVSTYFRPEKIAEDGAARPEYAARFRGRALRGRDLVLPPDYEGVQHTAVWRVTNTG